jgi:hypothetical protein
MDDSTTPEQDDRLQPRSGDHDVDEGPVLELLAQHPEARLGARRRPPGSS